MFESFVYHPEKGLRGNLSFVEITQALKDERSILWIDLFDIEDKDIDFLTSVFNLHPLTVEDFILPNARPKIEKFKDYFFLAVFSLESMNEGIKGMIKTSELDCCLGRHFLVTFHECPVSSLNMCKDRVRKQSPMMRSGTDMLLYSILDSCVDSYLPVIKEFDDLVDAMTDELFKDPNQDTLKKIYRLKNQIIHLRRTIGPQADTVSMLTRNDFEFITPGAVSYFRNVYDNLVRLNDVIGTSRDVIAGAMEAYVSITSNRLNEIMKKLTVITTIMMPLTLIASVYGMNFKHMPELNSPLGYPFVISIMIALTVSMLIYFRRKKWL